MVFGNSGLSDFSVMQGILYFVAWKSAGNGEKEGRVRAICRRMRRACASSCVTLVQPEAEPLLLYTADVTEN